MVEMITIKPSVFSVAYRILQAIDDPVHFSVTQFRARIGMLNVTTEGTEKTLRAQRGFMGDRLTAMIIGAAIEVHRLLGPGLLESIYESALCHEFEIRRLPFERQVSIDVIYKGHRIRGQRLDLVVDKRVVVEVKSVHAIPAVALAQVLSYLRASHLSQGLILNFGAPRLADGIKRVSL